MAARLIRLARLFQTEEKIDMTLYELRRGYISEAQGQPLLLKALPGGRFYVVDGAHRVIHALLHHQQSLPALIGYPYPVPGMLVSFVQRLQEPGAWKFGNLKKVNW